MNKKIRAGNGSSIYICLCSAVFTAALLSAVGCSNPGVSPVFPDYEKTVRSQSLVRAAETPWTDELDRHILVSENSSETKNTDPNVRPLTPDEKNADAKTKDSTKAAVSYSIRLPEGAFLSNGKKLPTPVYPSLGGFGSLDITEINAEERTFITSFLQALQNKKIDETFFTPSSSFYVPVLMFELDFFPAVTGWKIGKPYIGEIAGYDVPLYEVPVRLFAQKKYSDMTLYLVRTEKSVLIDQCSFGAFTDER